MYVCFFAFFIYSVSHLAFLFECPVYFDYILPPIIQCSSGHLVCSNYQLKLQAYMPNMQGTLLGSIRNLAIEKVTNTVLFPCRYSNSGCIVALPDTQKNEH